MSSQTVLNLVIGVAVLGLLIYRQLRARPVHGNQRLVLVLVVIGVILAAQYTQKLHSLSAASRLRLPRWPAAAAWPQGTGAAGHVPIDVEVCFAQHKIQSRYTQAGRVREHFRRRSGRRRPCSKASPGVSATSVGGHRSRDHAQHRPPAGDVGCLAADHLEPSQMRIEERVPARHAGARRRYATGSAKGPSDPPQSSHHHRRRCMSRPVWSRQAVSTVAVQVGQSSSPRHISPSEKRQPL
jgi:hypothetical protein